MSTAELIVDARNGVGESPVWNAAERALYWVDIPAKKLQRWDMQTGAVRSWTAPEMLACIAPHSAGGFIAGMETGIFHIRIGAGDALAFTLLQSTPHSAQGMRWNDGRCDRQGRFLAGSMVMDMGKCSNAGIIVSYTKSSGTCTIRSQLITPNGMAFSPDGRTLYTSDSHPSVQTVWASDYDTETGTPSNQRVFVDMHALPGRPDGAAVDTDGCYWICGNDAGLIHRFTPQGILDQSLAVPVKKPAMCAFGGDDMRTLFVTSIRPESIDLSDQPLAGGVFALRLGVRGLSEPVFLA